MMSCEECVVPSEKKETVIESGIIGAEHVDIYDIAKGIGIILIVLGHMHHFFAQDSKVYMYIYNFHVPLFIVLSGCVFATKGATWKQYFSKRFKGIIVPYIFASLLSILYAEPTEAGYSRYLDSMLIGNAHNGNLSYNVPLWYCTMIFAALMVFYFLVYFAGKFKNKQIVLACLSILTCVCGYCLIQKNVRLPWNIETSFVSQIYLFAGYSLKKFIKNQYEHKEYCYIGGALFIGLCIYAYTYKLNGRVDMNAGIYNNLALYIFNAALGVAIVMLASILIRRIFSRGWKVLGYLGKNSLYIMIFHRLAVSFAQGEIVRYMPKVVADNMWTPNAIGIIYWITMSVIFSLFWGLVYRMLFRVEK